MIARQLYDIFAIAYLLLILTTYRLPPAFLIYHLVKICRRNNVTTLAQAWDSASYARLSAIKSAHVIIFIVAKIIWRPMGSMITVFRMKFKRRKNLEGKNK